MMASLKPSPFFFSVAFLGICLVITVPGCFAQKGGIPEKASMTASYPENTILAGIDGTSISFDQLISEIRAVRIVYIGENHNNQSHHQVQQRIIRRLSEIDPGLKIGIEMVDRTYQPQLDLWTSGRLDEKRLIATLHWYANWRYPFSLYRDIFLLAREKHLSLVALNIPFHIPPKIATGGLDTLSADEKKFLPKTIDLGNKTHQEYVRKIFGKHQVPGFDNFDNFYAAQCVWDEAMAETISEHLSESSMVVLAGNGHIIYKFGIPDRAYRRNGACFRTIVLTEPDEPIVLHSADYIWVTN